jgi:two-component system chemotaxis response regulator CheY
MFNKNTRILIVDDMMTMRKLIAKTCKELGFTDLTEAADGALAWKAVDLANPPFGLVISDWNMPNSTGLDFLRKVRADGRFASLPFVMVTAEAEQSQIMEAIKAKVSNYLVKPFTSDALKEKLELVYQKHQHP